MCWLEVFRLLNMDTSEDGISQSEENSSSLIWTLIARVRIRYRNFWRQLLNLWFSLIHYDAFVPDICEISLIELSFLLSFHPESLKYLLQTSFRFRTTRIILFLSSAASIILLSFWSSSQVIAVHLDYASFSCFSAFLIPF